MLGRRAAWVIAAGALACAGAEVVSRGPKPETVAASEEVPTAEAPTMAASTAAPAPAPSNAVVTTTALAVPPVKDGVTPLPAEVQEIFLGSAEDPPTNVRLGVTTKTVGKQYLAGNEKTPQAFQPHIEGVGGGYVGVGSDQAYLLMGWMRPDVAWFVDYDPDVVAIHSVYKLFIENADTPAEMLKFWTKDVRMDAADMITEAYPGEQGEYLRVLFLQNRGWINRRLRGLSRRLDKAGVSHWLNDQATYDFVRAMLEAGRVRPLVANLLDDEGVRGVADAARKMGVPIRVLYLSNAEQYWDSYNDHFRKNIASLPFAEDAAVLRTLLIWDVNEDYRYNIQPAKNFVEWLGKPYTTNVTDITHKRAEADPKAINFFITDEPPDESPAARRYEESS